MPLFERGYRAAATTELERDIREIEEKDRKAQTWGEKDDAQVDSINSNLNFAERLNLITAQQADEYRRRVKKAVQEYEKMQKMEHRDDRVDDFENPRERADRYMDMEEAKAQIARERAHENATQSPQTRSNVEKTAEDEERTR